MKIEFVKTHNKYAEGDVVEMGDYAAKMLIKQKVAKESDKDVFREGDDVYIKTKEKKAKPAAKAKKEEK